MVKQTKNLREKYTEHFVRVYREGVSEEQEEVTEKAVKEYRKEKRYVQHS